LFTAKQIAHVHELPFTRPESRVANSGEIMLSNGRVMVGRWIYHSTYDFALFIEQSGQEWVIPYASMVAYSPQPEPIPTAQEKK
jgi:hypothetical protein